MKNKLIPDNLFDIDKLRMFNVLVNFPHQIEESLEIADAVDLKSIKSFRIKNIVVYGLGGSAIGGDLNRSYLSYEMKIPFIVNRNYSIPEFANDKTLSVISSYSGNTEETISAYREIIKRKTKTICITSGGEIENLCLKNKHILVKIPGGLQPRCAVGYSFFTLLLILSKLNLISSKKADIKETISLIKRRTNIYTKPDHPKNTAVKTALKLFNRLPVIYSSSDILDAVNLRWRGQICENAKMLAIGNFYPEMNHNEIVGWAENKNILKNTAVIFLEDADDHPRIKKRMEITESIYKNFTDTIIHLKGKGKSRLARIFNLIYLGDWVSYYLALLNKVDPTPVKVIESLKEKLKE